MPNLVFVHGAGGSPAGWNYLSQNLPGGQNIFRASYDINNTDPFEIIDTICEQVHETFHDQSVIYIGHSFGGVLGGWISASGMVNVEHLITISAPWQGSPFARWLKLVFRNNNLFHHMNPGSEFLEYLNEKTFLKPHTNIITTGGGNEVAAWGKRDNDGTVTVESQTQSPEGFTNTTHEFIDLSHTEILQCNKVKDLISRIANN
jgi:pimeloyl-ACP methyl ester carboxylesterase